MGTVRLTSIKTGIYNYKSATNKIKLLFKKALKYIHNDWVVNRHEVQCH